MSLKFCPIVLLYLVAVVLCDEAVTHSESSPSLQPETPTATITRSNVHSQSPSFPLPASQSSRSSASNINSSLPSHSDAVQSENTSSSTVTSSGSTDVADQQTHQPSRQSSTSHQPDGASYLPAVSPQDPVFIPIKEWKRRKLHDIELRVKQFQQAQYASATDSSPDPEVSAVVRPFLIYSNPQCNSLILFLRYQTCPFFHDETVRFRSSTSSPVPPSIPANTIPTEVPSKTHTEELPSNRRLSDAPRSTVTQIRHPAESSLGAVSATPSDHQLLPSRYSASKPKNELTGWIWSRSTGFATTLQRVKELFKSVREMSGLIGLTPFLLSFPHNPIFSTDGNLPRSSISLFSNDSAPHPDISLWTQLNVSNCSNQSSVDQRDSKNTNDSSRASEQTPLTFIEQFQKSNNSDEKPYNFASVDSGARVLLSSKGTIGAKNVLDNNVDKYLLVPCGEGGEREPRWVDVELSEEVILERFQTGNFEYYSSSPTKVIVLGSVTYPPNKWQLLGMFSFADVKSLQMFTIEKRVVTRYLRILFVGKQGREYYCPISAITAYGKTLIADWKDALNQQASMRRVETSRSPSSPPTTSLDQSLKQKPKEGTLSNESIESFRVASNDSDAADSKPGDGDRINKGEKASEFENSDRPSESQRGLDASRSEGSSKQEQQSPSTTEISQASEDTGHRDQASVGNEYSMSEEDQLVLEAVHADSLDQSSADDNVFRKVTRMLRLLELNQTLTNQYIDTQLAKFANLIQVLQEKTDSVNRERAMKSPELQSQLDSLREVITDIQYENRLKNVLIVVLLFVTCVLSSFLVAIRISSGATGALNTQRLVGGDHGIIMGDDSSDQEHEGSDVEQQNSRGRRKRKGRRRRRNAFEIPMEGATETTHLNGSVTPTETSENTLTTTFACTL